MSPNVVVRSPLVDELALGDYPDEVPAVSGPALRCVSWQDMRTTVSRTDLPRIPDPVHLAQADGPGPAIDFVGLPVGRSADLVVAARDGTAGSGTRYLITGAGWLFPLHDSASATALGLTESPAAVPEPVIAGLPAAPSSASPLHYSPSMSSATARCLRLRRWKTAVATAVHVRHTVAPTSAIRLDGFSLGWRTTGFGSADPWSDV